MLVISPMHFSANAAVPSDLASSDLARFSLSLIAGQGLNEGRCSFFELLAAVPGTLHHSQPSCERYDNTSKTIGIDCQRLVGCRANCFRNKLFKSTEQTLHALAHCGA